MDAASFLKRRTVAPTVPSGPEPASEQESSPLWIPETTPNGTLVEYCPDPRGYRVTAPPEYDNGDGSYIVREYEAVEVPSVTEVLNCLSKDGLSWWGQSTGLSGLLELLGRGVAWMGVDWESDKQTLTVIEYEKQGKKWTKTGRTVPASLETLTTALTANSLTVNHTLKKAGDRGTSVHNALEAWAKSGGLYFPTPANYNDEERPYVEGLLKWLDAGGVLLPERCEVMVGSAEHGFAGRYDLVITLHQQTEFVVKAYKRKQSKTVTVAPGRYLVDCKTSSGVYESHFLQLAAYEGASVECGYTPTDGQFVLHVTKDGAYEFVPSPATFEQFLRVRSTHAALSEIKAAR